MLSDRQKELAVEFIGADEYLTADGHSPTTLSPTSIRDVESWCASGTCGDVGESEAAIIAARIANDAHSIGLKYGDNWAPVVDCMTETEFAAYVDQALASA